MDAETASQLRKNVEAVIASSADASRALPLLHRLLRGSAEGSDDAIFAHGRLAEILLERSPWRASLHARTLVRFRPHDDRGWAALGLSQTLLGNYRFAARAFERARDIAPQNPWYAHNLGHLLDVALDRPAAALPHLHDAASSGEHAQVLLSLAHALARSGDLRGAASVLRRLSSREATSLLKWVRAGAPNPSPLARRRDVELDAGQTRGLSSPSLDRALEQGLANLPLNDAQRTRAWTAAYEAAHRRPPTDDRSARTVGAAAAYSVIVTDGVPLTQAEVAACFRVSVRSLRGRLGTVSSARSPVGRSS